MQFEGTYARTYIYKYLISWDWSDQFNAYVRAGYRERHMQGGSMYGSPVQMMLIAELFLELF